MYGCKRTANIISLNYNTYAVLTPTPFIRLIQEYPEYEKCLKDFVCSEYQDPRLKFITQVIKRIEYFSEAANDILYDIIFNLELIYHHKDDVVLDVQQDINSLMIIEEGQI